MKYLVKHEVKLDKHEASEDETGKTSTAETSWGLEEDNDVRPRFILQFQEIKIGAQPHAHYLTIHHLPQIFLTGL